MQQHVAAGEQQAIDEHLLAECERGVRSAVVYLFRRRRGRPGHPGLYHQGIAEGGAEGLDRGLEIAGEHDGERPAGWQQPPRALDEDLERGDRRGAFDGVGGMAVVHADTETPRHAAVENHIDAVGQERPDPDVALEQRVVGRPPAPAELVGAIGVDGGDAGEVGCGILADLDARGGEGGEAEGFEEVQPEVAAAGLAVGEMVEPVAGVPDHLGRREAVSAQVVLEVGEHAVDVREEPAVARGTTRVFASMALNSGRNGGCRNRPRLHRRPASASSRTLPAAPRRDGAPRAGRRSAGRCWRSARCRRR